MQTSIPPSIKERQSLHSGVLCANEILEDELGPSAGPVAADWSLDQDERGRPVLTLRLTDVNDSATGRFSPEELANPSHLGIRLVRLWGDLLQERLRKQVQKLHQLLQQDDEG